MVAHAVEHRPAYTRDAWKRILTVGGFEVLTLGLMLGCAGRMDWGPAWALAGTSVAISLVGLASVSRDVVSERGKKKENVEPWDLVLTRLLNLPWLAQYVVAGLDARFGWTPEWPIGVHLAGLVGYALGYGLVIAAMRANRFFSSAVRIQADRGQVVCTTGPYRFVRHPGYVGMIGAFLATPLALGSWWTLVPSGLVVLLLVVRTALEDRTLTARLEGYATYARTVRFRLVPGLW